RRWRRCRSCDHDWPSVWWDADAAHAVSPLTKTRGRWDGRGLPRRAYAAPPAVRGEVDSTWASGGRTRVNAVRARGAGRRDPDPSEYSPGLRLRAGGVRD